MYFEEQIEQIKNEFSSSEFKIPFNNATQILKTIESHFIRQKDINKSRNNIAQNCNDWACNIKEKERIEIVQLQSIDDFLDRFEHKTNYWLVIAWCNNPQIKHQIYDTELSALKAIVSIHQNDFFIIDKKYNWFYFFEVDKENNIVSVYKSINNKKS
ncbi:MAG: hypothetical protein V4585_01675 [Bacteroidota bacterium]